MSLSELREANRRNAAEIAALEARYRDDLSVITELIQGAIGEALETAAKRAEVGYQMNESCDDIARDIREMKP